MHSILFILGLFTLPALAQEARVFTDARRGYAIEYASPLQLAGGRYGIHDTDHVAVLLNGEKILYGDFESMDAVAFINFRRFATRLCVNQCSADGPDGSSWAEEIDSVRVLTNQHGVAYAELYLLRRSEGEDGKRSEIVGPFFVINIATRQDPICLFLRWQWNWKPTTDQTSAGRAIVDGIKMLRR